MEKNTSPSINVFMFCGQALTFTIDDFKLSATVPLFVLHNEALVEEVQCILCKERPLALLWISCVDWSSLSVCLCVCVDGCDVMSAVDLPFAAHPTSIFITI